MMENNQLSTTLVCLLKV